jgi:hypothetical protein
VSDDTEVSCSLEWIVSGHEFVGSWQRRLVPRLIVDDDKTRPRRGIATVPKKWRFDNQSNTPLPVYFSNQGVHGLEKYTGREFQID